MSEEYQDFWDEMAEESEFGRLMSPDDRLDDAEERLRAWQEINIRAHERILWRETDDGQWEVSWSR